MSPLVITVVAMIIAVLVLFIAAAIRKASRQTMLLATIWCGAIVTIIAIGSQFSVWMFWLRDTELSASESLIVIALALASTVVTLRLRKVYMTKYGSDPIPS